MGRIGARALGVAATGYLAALLDVRYLIVSFGSTAVLVFGAPESRFAQPRNVVVGHLVGLLVGLVFLALLGSAWWSMALALGVAVGLMHATKTLHPPPGTTLIAIIVERPDWAEAFYPTMAGSLILVILAAVFNNLPRDQRYPVHWF